MATTYKNKDSAVPVPLTARVYADGVEIHIYHELASCLHYQWFFDDLLGGSPVEITGATSKEYQVDLTSVANSGEYYCEIKVGMTGCSDQVTERRRVSIIECVHQEVTTYGATNANGQVRATIPHYETAVYSSEGVNWITPIGSITYAVVSANVRTALQQFSLTDQVSSSNSARRGQVSLTVGGHVCYFSIGQDFIRTVAADTIPVLPDPPPGPVLTLTQNGPVFVDDSAVIIAQLSYVTNAGQTAPTIPDGNGQQVVFTVDDGLGFQDRDGVTLNSFREFSDLLSWQQKFTRHTAQDRVVTGTYTDPNGTTVSNTITVKFKSRAELPTEFSGGTPSATLDWLYVPQQNGIFGYISARNPRVQSTLSFSFTGGGLWEMSITIHPWGINPVTPTQDRPVKLSIEQTTGGARSTDGGVDWDDLGTAINPLMEAPIGGAVVQETFKFQGIGNIFGKLNLLATDRLGFTSQTDDMNILVLVEIRPQT